MKERSFSLIVCTYMRSNALQILMESVQGQSLYPNEILIVDGSTNQKTEQMLKYYNFKNLSYYKVDSELRGLTKQRNYGVSKISPNTEIICFLDDDTVLESDYFYNLIGTYVKYPKALGVGGYIINEVEWQLADGSQSSKQFYIDGWRRDEPLRYRVRKRLGLLPDKSVGFLPTFGHGRSVSFLPPTYKIYPVELFMGGVSSYKVEVFKMLEFSTYFKGYGLYEDADFCLRLSQIGKLYVNTAARLSHYHEASGRPESFEYGKMIVRNGWYVWRVKYSSPKFKAQLKWHLNVFLLLILTGLGGLKNLQNTNVFKEVGGRTVGWVSLFFNKPKL